MRQVDFYFHNSCLSRQSIRLLAKDVEAVYPSWTVTVHPLTDQDIERLGFSVLPVVLINGQTVATGMPSKEWLLRKVTDSNQRDQ